MTVGRCVLGEYAAPPQFGRRKQGFSVARYDLLGMILTGSQYFTFGIKPAGLASG
jgi:hypothetical protein